MKISHVVAVGTRQAIGLKGQLPWHAPSDLKHFKAVTMGKMLLMGRKTFQSVGEPLKGRLNLVVTKNPQDFKDISRDNLKFFASIPEALNFAESQSKNWGDELCVVGGAEIYLQTFQYADTLMISKIDYEGEGDTFYPVVPSDFQLMECKILNPGPPLNKDQSTQKSSEEPRTELFLYERNSPPTKSLDQNETLSRRTFMGQATGYAIAVSPVTALAMSTPADGLETGFATLKTTDQKELLVYKAKAKAQKPKGVVIVIQEIFGLHEYIKDVTRRLAKEGYAAFAPDLYFRQGDATKIPSIDELRQKIVSKVSQTQVLLDLDKVYEYAAGLFPSLPVFVTGFCWGGSMTWLYCDHNHKVKRGVAWYGRLRLDKSPLVSKEPLDVVTSLKVPVLGLYGGKDKGIPLADVDLMNEKLKAQKQKNPSSIKVYSEADHGFHADYRPTYNPEAARDGWKQMLAFFQT